MIDTIARRIEDAMAPRRPLGPARRANWRRGVMNQRHQVAQHLAERYRRPAKDVIINRVIAR